MKKEKKTTEKDQVLEDFLRRKGELILARRNSGMEEIWRQADADYLPGELGAPKKKVLVENERTDVSSFVSLEKNQWRSKLKSNDPYIKIQTALAILFDRNPEAVFDPASRRYEATTKLMEALYHRTWTDVNIGAKKELRKFIFNLGKYGWAPARRYHKRVVRKDMNKITRYNTETNLFEFEKKDIIDLDDAYFESKNPFDVWIDDMARPDDPRTRRDVMWREVYDKVTATNVFGKDIADTLNYSNYVEDENSAKNSKNQQYTSQDLVTIYFYENRLTDQFIIESNGVFVKPPTPLMREDKELSIEDTYWTLRSTESPYGIGINEIMRGNKIMYDRIRNMSIDQVVLSIYKMFFYSGAEQLSDEGGETVELTPGKGKKVIDPKNIAWSDIPGPGKDSYIAQENLTKDMENDTGINRTLGGEITGATANEVSMAKEGALKRMAIPLRNIKSFLEWDAKLTVNIIKMVYSIPKVIATTDPDIISNYIASITKIGDDGQPVTDQEMYIQNQDGVFNILKYREYQLALENNNGNFEPSGKKNFFQTKPSVLDWDGQINIRVESMVEQSQALERQDTMQMENIIFPMMLQMASNPALVPVLIKPVKETLKVFDKNPKDWLPEQWLDDQIVAALGQPPVQPGMPVDPNAMPAEGNTIQAKTDMTPPEAQTVAPSMPVINTPEARVASAAQTGR